MDVDRANLVRVEPGIEIPLADFVVWLRDHPMVLLWLFSHVDYFYCADKKQFDETFRDNQFNEEMLHFLTGIAFLVFNPNIAEWDGYPCHSIRIQLKKHRDDFIKSPDFHMEWIIQNQITIGRYSMPVRDLFGVLAANLCAVRKIPLSEMLVVTNRADNNINTIESHMKEKLNVPPIPTTESY